MLSHYRIYTFYDNTNPHPYLQLLTGLVMDMDKFRGDALPLADPSTKLSEAFRAQDGLEDARITFLLVLMEW